MDLNGENSTINVFLLRAIMDQIKPHDGRRWWAVVIERCGCGLCDSGDWKMWLYVMRWWLEQWSDCLSRLVLGESLRCGFRWYVVRGYFIHLSQTWEGIEGLLILYFPFSFFDLNQTSTKSFVMKGIVLSYLLHYNKIKSIITQKFTRIYQIISLSNTL